jgi:triacylglycerol lipase
MLARLQQALTLGLLTLAALWAVGFAWAGHPGWAAAGALAIVFGYAAFLAIEVVMVYCTHGEDPAPRASAAQLIRAWFAEVLTAPRVFCWQQPFRSKLHADLLTAAPGQRGVVLVHGFVCNRGMWNRWMPRLRARGVPHIAVNREPVFGSIAEYAPAIEAAVKRMESATGLAPVVVGHSMGGLAIRGWLAAFDAYPRVHRVVTIGSPHHGTWLGRFATSANGREMSLSHSWRESLRATEDVHGFERFVCFYSHCDNVVFPPSNATLPGADNRHVPGSAHVQLLDRLAVFDAVLDCLAEGAATTKR